MSLLLPSTLYPVAAVRALDAAAIASGIPGRVLMQRAGRAAWQVALRRWPTARVIAVVCGPGNNGGDAYVVAAAAAREGREVRLIEIGEISKSGADAQACRAAALRAGLLPGTGMQALDGADLIIDGLFGIGLTRAPTGDLAHAINAMNASARPILSLDVPSGLDADTGGAPGDVVRATATITFIALKQGLVTGAAADCVGTLEFDGLDVPAGIYAAELASAVRLAIPHLAARRRGAHKGNNGHVLVVGGAPGYAGAARLAAEAALRCGAGLVSVAAMPECVPLIHAGRPEVMVHAVRNAEELAGLLARASVVAIGPGLGQDAWGRQMFAAVRDVALPLVVDADALNLLAANPQFRADWCLTPHPGEGARLLGEVSPALLNRDRFMAVRRLRETYGGTVLLKGAGTLIADEQGIGVVTAGNPGMASGGMGDVLTGVIAALRAQGLSMSEAARQGACLHAAAADRATARDGERGLLASDLLLELRRLVN